MESIDFLKADAAIDSPYLLVTENATAGEVELTNSNTDSVIGVVPAKHDALACVRAIPQGPVKLIAEGAIARGQALCPSDSTNGAVQACDDDDFASYNVIGYALDAAADGEDFHAVIECADGYALSYSVGAEASDVITVAIAANRGGENLRFMAELFDADGDLATVSAFHLGTDTAGQNVSTTDQVRIFAHLDANGEVNLEITDVATGSGATKYVKVTPLGHPGFAPIAFDVTFD